jgi:hypothetical protein
MPKIEGIKQLKRRLDQLRKDSKREDGASVRVGYTASYAVYVHEDLTAHHTVGQAKFLLDPARALAKELGTIVATARKRGASTGQGLLLAGLRLQRASQELVPVDTGNLRASAFTRQEK